jgi:hypothetical protein
MVGIGLIKWYTVSAESEPVLRVPFLTQKCKVDILFQRQIEQIVFPPCSAEYEELHGMVK